MESDRSINEADNRVIEEQHSSQFEDESFKDIDDEKPEKGQLEQEEAPEGGVDKNEMDGLRLSLTSLRDIHVEDDPLKSNRILSALLEQEREEASPIGIEEVFK